MSKSLLKIIGHTALGGFAAGLVMIPSGAPLTVKTILFPALASAVTSIISLFALAPKQKE